MGFQGGMSMKGLKRLGLALIWLAAACAACFGVSILLRSGESEILFRTGRTGITVAGAGAALSVLAGGLFTEIRLTGERRSISGSVLTGQRVNALGFGFFPSVCVWKVFEDSTRFGTGASVPNPLPLTAWLSEDGMFCPSRIEMVCAVICFAGLCLWLICRRKEIPGNGDLLGIVLCMWTVIRMTTEPMRGGETVTAAGWRLIQLIACAGSVIGLIWALASGHGSKSLANSVTLAVMTTAGIAACMLFSGGILTAGSEIGDFAVRSGGGGLALIGLLCCIRDSRTKA